MAVAPIVNCLFYPYMGSTVKPPAAEAQEAVALNKINMSQQILLRFGVFYSSFLEPDVVEALEKLTSPEIGKGKPLLAARVKIIKKQYEDLLRQGSTLLQTTLACHSTLGGCKTEQVVKNYFAPLKYLPMPVEELLSVLVCSPSHTWTLSLRMHFESFLADLTSTLTEDRNALETLIKNPHTLPDPFRLQNFLLSRAALPETPFIDALAQWMILSPNTFLEQVCQAIGLSFEFFCERCKFFEPVIQELGPIPLNLSFRSFLCWRSLFFFCTHLNLILLPESQQKIVSYFEEHEEIRRAFVFFASSLPLQNCAPSEHTAKFPFHFCISFFSWRRAFFHASLTPLEISPLLTSGKCTVQKEDVHTAFSLIFEWLFEAGTQEFHTFFSFIHTFTFPAIFTAFHDLRLMPTFPHGALSRLCFLLKERAFFLKASQLFTPCEKIPLTAIFETIFSAPPHEQQMFFATLSADNLPPPVSLTLLEGLTLSSDKMLAVLRFLCMHTTVFCTTFATIDVLTTANPSSRCSFKLLFLEDITTSYGKRFLKVLERFMQLRLDLGIKFYHQFTDGEEKQKQFHQAFDPLFLPCLHASAEEVEELFTIGIAFQYFPLLQTLHLLPQIECLVNTQLAVMLSILTHWEHFISSLRVIEALVLDPPFPTCAQLKQQLWEALRLKQPAKFFNTVTLFLKFKAFVDTLPHFLSSQQKDRVFASILNDQENNTPVFTAFLQPAFHTALCVALNLIEHLRTPLSHTLKILNELIKAHSFFASSFKQLTFLTPPDQLSALKLSFVQRYTEEKTYIKCHIKPHPHTEKMEEWELHRYVCQNLQILHSCILPYSYPEHDILLDLCFYPLLSSETSLLERFNAFLVPFKSTQKSPDFYAALQGFIKERFTPSHLKIIHRLLKKLALLDHPYNIYTILRYLDLSPEFSLTTGQAAPLIALLTTALGKRLTAEQSVTLFFKLVEQDPSLVQRQLCVLQTLEELTHVPVHPSDIFNWMAYSPVDAEAIDQLATLVRSKTLIRGEGEQLSLPLAASQPILALITALQETFTASSGASPETCTTLESFKRQIETSVILVTLPSLAPFFSLNALVNSHTFTAPLDPHYPHHRVLSLRWFCPQASSDTPRVTLLLSHLVHALVLPLPLHFLQTNPLVLEFLYSLLNEGTSETKQISGIFQQDFYSFPLSLQEKWQSLTLHACPENHTPAAIAQILYDFVLQIKLRLRKEIVDYSARECT